MPEFQGSDKDIHIFWEIPGWRGPGGDWNGWFSVNSVVSRLLVGGESLAGEIGESPKRLPC